MARSRSPAAFFMACGAGGELGSLAEHDALAVLLLKSLVRSHRSRNSG